MSTMYTVMFKDLPSYEKYKKEIVEKGGTIKHDYGIKLLGVTATIPATFIQLMRTDSLTEETGIISLEEDSKVTIQPHANDKP